VITFSTKVQQSFTVGIQWTRSASRLNELVDTSLVYVLDHRAGHIRSSLTAVIYDHSWPSWTITSSLARHPSTLRSHSPCPCVGLYPLVRQSEFVVARKLSRTLADLHLQTQWVEPVNGMVVSVGVESIWREPIELHSPVGI